jgi:hypothetical protein
MCLKTPSIAREWTDASKVDVATGELAQEVTLDPMAKDFNERKAELKELGYAWNSEKKVWKLFIAINLPSIEHPAFVSLLILST